MARTSKEQSWWSTVGEALRGTKQDLTAIPIRRAVVLLAVPTVLEMSMESLLTIVDIFFVSKLGSDAVATVGLTESMLSPVYALAMGLGDKGVSLLYERVLRKEQLDLWVERCKSQISGVLEVLENERAAVTTPWWFGERIGHADIALACVLRFTGEAHPALFDARYPALQAHAARCEALPPFQEIVQPLAPPSGD